MAHIDDSARASELTSTNPFVPTGVLMMERDTGKMKLGPGFWTDLEYWPPVRTLIVTFSTGNVTLTNMAAAEAIFQDRSITKVDLTNYTEVRLVTNVTTVSTVVGAEINLQYHTAYTETAADYTPIGTSAVSTSLETDGVSASAWVPLVGAAKADVFLSLILAGGDGAADPVTGHISAQFR